MDLRRIFLLLLSVTLTAPAWAQISGGLQGRVTDTSGASIARAQVTLTRTSTGVKQRTETTADGYYTFPQLPPGSYSVEVAATGFASVLRQGVTVVTGQAARVDVPLNPGGGHETVTVTEDVPLLQSEQSNIQTNIPGRTVAAIPLNTRNFIQLSTLAPGVELPPGTLLPRINGGRPRTNEYLFDGISALQPEPGQVVFFPILDDIQEFTIEANNVPAEFGRFNGGVVNVTTRSGTNEFHGSLFEYLRNEDLNARNYFARPPARKPEYRRNLYGGTIGGPVLHDRLFFFGDYQGIRQAIGVVRTSTIPTTGGAAGRIYRRGEDLRSGDDGVQQRNVFTDGVSERRDHDAAGSGGGGAAVAVACANQRAARRTTTRALRTMPITRTSSMCGWMARWARAIARLGATRTTTRWRSRCRRCRMGAG